jgi:hypothetical protein
MLKVNGRDLQGDVWGGPVLCDHDNPNECYQPNQADGLAIRLSPVNRATLIPSVSTLGLSVNCPPTTRPPNCAQTNLQLTGKPRQLTITNTGSVDATHVVVSTSRLPSDASVLAPSCETITANGGTCEITVTPGAITSSNASGTLCTAGISPEGSVNVTADGGLSASVNIYVLSYGCSYQGGFIYSVDDTTDTTGSIGGKVLALMDQKPRFPNGIVWDADPACGSDSNQCTLQTGAQDFYYGENLATILGSTNPNNTGSNGPGNTNQIVSRLNGRYNNTDDPANYAAAVCTAYTTSIYADWYLPTICDLGDLGSCNKYKSSVAHNLGLLLSDPNNDHPDTSCYYGMNCLAGFYWSSTEYLQDPKRYAWGITFTSGNNSSWNTNGKNNLLGVRCSRDLTR